jgi:hypothetical protein
VREADHPNLPPVQTYQALIELRQLPIVNLCCQFVQTFLQSREANRVELGFHPSVTLDSQIGSKKSVLRLFM